MCEQTTRNIYINKYLQILTIQIVKQASVINLTIFTKILLYRLYLCFIKKNGGK